MLRTVNLALAPPFWQMREVVGELVAANAIDLRGVPYILHRSAAFPTNISTVPPFPRPQGVPRVDMGDIFRTEEIAAWRANAIQDAVRPTVEGYFVLASTAVYERRHFRNEWIVEQYSGPDVGPADDGLWTQLKRLPRIIITDSIGPLYDGPAEGAVVRPEPDIAGIIDPHMVMLCPLVAAELGWRPDPQHIFRYLDADEQVVAQTIHWRDGGVSSREYDTTALGQGYTLLVRQDQAEKLRPFLAGAQISRAWRITQGAGQEDRVVASGTLQMPQCELSHSIEH